MNDKIKQITELLLKLKDVDISKYEVTFLEKSLQKRIEKTNSKTEEGYCAYVSKNEVEATHFLDSLYVNYSEFFRNSLTFSVLERIVLPSIIFNKTNSNQKEIRIWSAACAAGQETYSLAMLLHELKNNDGEKLNFRIFATDYSETQIDEARKGQYSVEASSKLSLKHIKQWFTKQGNTFVIKDELKENIDFSVFDLFNEDYSCPPNSIFGDFDLIICANLLFYYKPEYQNTILGKLTHSLTKGGYLATGETERCILMQHDFEEMFPQSAIFKKKQ